MANEIISIELLKNFHDNIATDAHILQRSVAYTVDNIVNKGFIYLKCIQAGTTSSTALSLSGVSVGDELTDGTVKWQVISINGDYGDEGNGINIWITGTAYEADDMVLYQNVIYKCNTDHTSTTFSADALKWDFVYSNIQDWAASTYYKEKSSVIYNHKLYQCITAHTSTSTFDESKWQLIGDYVTAPCKIGEVGYVSWQYTLMENHLALNGGTVNDFNAIYPELYDFFDTNNLITDTQATYDDNKMLLLYDSSTDTATMPNFIGLVPQGASTLGEIKAGLPNIKGTASVNPIIDATSDILAVYVRNKSGALTSIPDTNTYKAITSSSTAGNAGADVISLDASQYNNIYSDSVNTVQPPAAGLIPQIRYKKDTFEASVDNIYNDTPIGTVISYMGTTPPREYLSCDGSVYNIASYQALADFINDTFGSYNYFGGDGVTTFAVPDLRGEFLRGTGTNSHANQGSGANVGVHQDGTLEPVVLGGYSGGNAKKIEVRGVADGGGNISVAQADVLLTGDDLSNSKIVSTANTGTVGDLTATAGSKFTSRPTNTSVLYCIKYTVATKPQSLRDWTTDTLYIIGDFVIEDNTMYRCIIDHISTVFEDDLDDNYWELVTSGSGSGSGLQDWVASASYKEDNIFVYDGQIYKAKVGFISGSTFENIQILEDYTLSGGETPIPYAKGTEISIDDIVSYDNNYYKALYDFVCGEDFSVYAFEEYVPKQLTAIQEQEIINHFLPNIIGNGTIVIEDSTPIGTIISFMGTQTPDCYLICNGQTYNIVDYSELAEFINTQFGSYNYFGGDGITTFAVPDLRGEFLRGTGTNSHTNQGSGASVGTHQNGTEHLSINTYDTYINIMRNVNNVSESNADSNISGANHDRLAVDGGIYATGASYYKYTSRPTNTSVLYCIKYKMSTRTDSGGGSSEGGTIDEWDTSTNYKTGNFVVYENILYKCLANHTSGTFATDYANGKWQEIGETATTAQIEALFI